MRLFKKVFSLMLCLTLVFSLTVPIKAEDFDVMGTIDNSNTNITVTQDGTTIYTGTLGNYDNGKWKYADFSQMDILAIWDLTLDTTYIITPDESQSNETQSNIVPHNEMSPSMSALQLNPLTLNNNLSCEVSIMYNGVYSENVLIQNKYLTVPIKLYNSGSIASTASCYVAEYDSNGKLINISTASDINIKSHSTMQAVLEKQINPTAETAKIFVWDGIAMTPVIDSITLLNEKQDFYPDDKYNAQEISMLTPIVGSINYVGDVDYFKFTIPESTKYSFTCSNDNAEIILYDNHNNIIDRGSHFESNLQKNSIKYLKIISNSTLDYAITINKLNDIDLDFNIYDFDEQLQIYKKEIANQNNKLFDLDEEAAIDFYKKYDNLLTTDAELHSLPDYINDADNTNYDTLVKECLAVKSEEFYSLKNDYWFLLNEINGVINDVYQNSFLPPLVHSDGEDEEIEDEGHGAMGQLPSKLFDENLVLDEINNIDVVKIDDHLLFANQNNNQNEPSLTIVDSTSTSITFNVIFTDNYPNMRRVGLIDFNEEATTTNSEITAYGHRITASGTYTIRNLIPGGIYILYSEWSTNGKTYSGENTIFRRVKLDYDTIDTQKIYSKYENQYIIANIETSDLIGIRDDYVYAWLDRMDIVYDALNKFTGYIPYNGDKISINSVRRDLSEYQPDGQNYWRIIMGYSGNPIEISQPFYKSQLRRIYNSSRNFGDWGDTPIHELSHDFDRYIWRFDDEAMSYLKMAYILETVSNSKIYRVDTAADVNDGWYSGTNYYNFLKFDCYESYLKTFGNSEHREYSHAGLATILIDIKNAIDNYAKEYPNMNLLSGWDAFSKTFKILGNLEDKGYICNISSKFNYFLTILDNQTPVNVFNVISEQDKELIGDYFNESVHKLPDIFDSVIDDDIMGARMDFDAVPGDYRVYQFKPSQSGVYDIFTSPYGETAMPNNTMIELREGSSETGRVIDSNDNNGGSVFSKIQCTLDGNKIYSVRVFNSNNRLHARLNIQPHNINNEISLNTPKQISVQSTVISLMNFTTAAEGGDYSIAVTDASNTSYIKLYSDENLTHKISGDNKRIVEKLDGNRTYYIQFCGLNMRAASGSLLVTKYELAQEIKFNKNENEGGKPHYYLYDDHPEHIRECDLVDGSNEGRLLAHFENLEPGIYTVFSYHHVDSTLHSVNQAINYDAGFYNNSNNSGKVKINRIGVFSAGQFIDGVRVGWNAQRKSWDDYNDILDRNININNGNNIENSIYMLSDLSNIIIPSNTPTNNLYQINYSNDTGVVHMIMEFEVMDGSINFATFAYKNKTNAENIITNNFNVIESIYEDLNTITKGKGRTNSIIKANPIEYYITDSSPQFLPVKIVNDLFDENSNNIHNIFTTHSSQFDDNSKYTTVGSSSIQLIYDGDGIIRSNNTIINKNNGWIFDDMHTRNVDNIRVPDNCSQYFSDSYFDKNTSMESYLDRIKNNIDKPELFQFLGGNATQGIETPAIICPSTAYELTYEYNVTIHNKTKENIHFRFLTEPNLAYIKLTNNGIGIYDNYFEINDKRGLLNRNVGTCEIQKNETSVINIQFTLITGSNPTVHNAFTINIDDENILNNNLLRQR